MPQSLDINSEQFLELLGDALRTGPGSPQWHQAVQALRSQTGAEGDEYRLLIAAREHLESGREYRSVRAGPGFTHRLLERLETERPGRGWPMASVLAIASVVMVGLAIGIGVYLMMRPVEPAPPGVEMLARTQFVQPVEVARFDEQIPPRWEVIGQLPVAASGGLGLSGPRRPDTEAAGGGVYHVEPWPAGQPIAIETVLRVTRTSTPLVAQVFVTDQPQFSADRATSPHELVWSLQQGQARIVLPDQQLAGEAVRVTPQETLLVRIRLDAQHAIIETAGQQQWAGPHQLPSDLPRHIGVRLLSTGRDPVGHVTVQSVRVLKP